LFTAPFPLAKDFRIYKQIGYKQTQNSLSREDIDSPSINSFKKRRARQMDFYKDIQSTSPIFWLQDCNDKVHVGLDRVSPRQVQAHQVNKKGSPYSITERRVPELIPSFGSQPAGDMSHKPGGRLPLLSARPAVTLATLKRAATNFAAW